MIVLKHIGLALSVILLAVLMAWIVKQCWRDMKVLFDDKKSD